MTMLTRLLAAAAVIGGTASAAAAQYYPQPQPYPQPYPAPQYPQTYPGYPQQGYGYGQQNPLGQIIGQLLGNRYNVQDRTAVQQCASAAMAQAAAQYAPRNPYGQPGYGNQGYGNQGYGYQGYGYQQGYNPAANMRVTAITNVERRQYGLRVSGLIDSRGGYPPYGQAYGYQNQGYAAAGDLSFRCNVDYRGVVTNLRVRRAGRYRG
jgi:hypothetical protein